MMNRIYSMRGLSRELNQLDNKDAYYMATATKKAIKMLKEGMWMTFEFTATLIIGATIGAIIMKILGY